MTLIELSPADLITGPDGEPRIVDIHLAGLLGYTEPRQIRRLVARNLEPLQALGTIGSRGTMVGIGSGAQREITEYLLSKQQALYLAAKSQTARAAEITVRMVQVFDAWLSSRAALPVLPPSSPAALEPLLTAEARALLRYRRLGLSTAECARLLGRGATSVKQATARLRAAGLLPAPQGGSLRHVG